MPTNAYILITYDDKKKKKTKSFKAKHVKTNLNGSQIILLDLIFFNSHMHKHILYGTFFFCKYIFVISLCRDGSKHSNTYIYYFFLFVEIRKYFLVRNNANNKNKVRDKMWFVVNAFV